MVIDDRVTTGHTGTGDWLDEVRIGRELAWTDPGVPTGEFWYQAPGPGPLGGEPAGPRTWIVRGAPKYFQSRHVPGLAWPDLTTIRFGAGTVSIGDRAFQGCPGLSWLEFPGSLECIGKQAFDGATGVKTLRFEGRIPPGIGPWAFGGAPVRVVYVPTGCTEPYRRVLEGVGLRGTKIIEE